MIIQINLMIVLNNTEIIKKVVNLSKFCKICTDYRGLKCIQNSDVIVI